VLVKREGKSAGLHSTSANGEDRPKKAPAHKRHHFSLPRYTSPDSH
jgi:hypothetical protein